MYLWYTIFAVFWLGFLSGTANSKVVRCDKKKIDLGILLDASASIGERRFNLSKRFAKELISRFDVCPRRTRVGLNTFSAYHRIITKFSEPLTVKVLKTKVDAMFYEQSFSELATAVEALHQSQFVKKAGARPKTKGVKMVLVVVTDGMGTEGYEELRDKAKQMRDYHVEIFTVYPKKTSQGQPVPKKFVKTLSSKPLAKHSYELNKRDEIKAVVNKIVKQVCTPPEDEH